MKFRTVCLIGLVSLTLASPLNRRQETQTVTATVTLSGSPAAATSSSQPLVPILPSDIQSLGSVTASPASTGATAGSDTTSSEIDVIPKAASATLLPAAALSSSSLTPIIPSSTPDPYSTSEAKDPCQAFCDTVNLSKDVCLENCQVIDGNAQINAPGKTFPPNNGVAASTATPTPSPTTTVANHPDQCKEFCKSDVRLQLRSRPVSVVLPFHLHERNDLQVIDGQVQVNAPGKAFPPVREATASSSATAALPSVAVNVIEKACEATCELGSKDYGNCMESCLALGGTASEAGGDGGGADA
ncbi:MAG: hypothetical protein LQ343_005744 [Gyalolechia ehrenbergii]|nr:MAG: hypothetical protein LQ343_005744 [Gyalolechia ehrenbergii]